MSKKLEVKQERRRIAEERLAERKRAARRRNLITFGIAGLVTALVVFLIMSERGGEENVGVAAGKAGCDAIERDEVTGEADHVDEGTTQTYEQDPPTSGPHYATPAAPDFYTDDIEKERVVHNLEHGFIVFWYDPDAPDDTVEQIENLVDQEADASVGVPYDNVPSGKTFVMTAWGASQACARPSQKVVDDFRTEFQGQGPEKIVPPFDPD